MAGLCDTIISLLQPCLERFDETRYDQAVAKLKFLGEKYMGLRKAHDWTGVEAMAALDLKVKTASKLVRDIRTKWGAKGDETPQPRRKVEAPDVKKKELEVEEEQEVFCIL